MYMKSSNTNTYGLLSIVSFLGAILLLWRAHVSWAQIHEGPNHQVLQQVREILPHVSKPVEMGPMSLWALNEDRILVILCVLSIALCAGTWLLTLLARRRQEASHLYAGPAVLSIAIAYMSARLIFWMPVFPY